MQATMAPLRRVRTQQLLTQAELAKAAGVSLATVNQIEGGRQRRPEIPTIRAICRALGVDPLDVDEFRRVLAASDGGAG